MGLSGMSVLSADQHLRGLRTGQVTVRTYILIPDTVRTYMLIPDKVRLYRPIHNAICNMRPRNQSAPQGRRFADTLLILGKT